MRVKLRILTLGDSIARFVAGGSVNTWDASDVQSLFAGPVSFICICLEVNGKRTDSFCVCSFMSRQDAASSCRPVSRGLIMSIYYVPTYIHQISKWS